jgi:hypothetical protein
MITTHQNIGSTLSYVALSDQFLLSALGTLLSFDQVSSHLLHL